MFHIEFNNFKLREDSLPHTTASDRRSTNDRNADKYRSSNIVDAEYKHMPRPLTTTTEEPTISNDTRERIIVKRIGDHPLKQGEETVWLFDKKYAPWLARAIERGCIKNRGVKRTVEKIEAANIIPNDQSEGSRLFRYYLNEAREKNDASYLVTAYTLQSFFYRYLNKYMATGNPKKVYKKLCRKWSGYFTGALMRNPAMEVYYYRGETYRGMPITFKDLEIYKVGALFVNKAFQSTTKLMDVALEFSQPDPPTDAKESIVIIYKIRNRTTALDIGHISYFQGEEEVLMMPGCLFRVEYIDESRKPIENSKISANIHTIPLYIHVQQI
ncbi:unnamed protein product [Adineta steineri]|uniref:NAD(P)(+)--arginine ADP-ribosyltransferase n=1 Tax=Adineta steineri TaxID=433720 RepID=A0A815HBM4_9BILA|nr:unnamed protein product [Adineta steineri]CAF1166184.1 unnamed protein product [Adineta steineri]CAF1351807.1 unnamed protein product [Adineta steineri]